MLLFPPNNQHRIRLIHRKKTNPRIAPKSTQQFPTSGKQINISPIITNKYIIIIKYFHTSWLKF